MLDRDNQENLLLLLNYISNMYKNYKNYIKFNNNNRNYIILSYFSQHSPKNVMEQFCANKYLSAASAFLAKVIQKTNSEFLTMFTLRSIQIKD